jgi:hypothetical protein
MNELGGCNMNNIESLNQYLKTNFESLQLCKSLFYNSKVGIRFEIGNPDIDYSDNRYIQFAYIRSILLFEEIFSPNTEIYLIVNEHIETDYITKENHGTNVFNEYLIDKNKIDEVDCVKLPYCYQEEGEEIEFNTYRYCLSCKVRDVNYRGLIASIANQDMGIKPSTNDEVYFINKNEKIIYNLYDDRGLDIVAKEKENLMKIYVKYNDWILDYDRKAIDQTFCVK